MYVKRDKRDLCDTIHITCTGRAGYRASLCQKRELRICQKRPTYMSNETKETYVIRYILRVQGGQGTVHLGDYDGFACAGVYVHIGLF